MSLSKGVTLLAAHAKSFKPRARTAEFEKPSSDRREIQFALNYLDTFGYLAGALSGLKDLTLGDLIEGIKKFQETWNIPKTGNLCAKVIKAMELPRCGHPDFLRADHVGYARVRDFAESKLPAWQKRTLKYCITDYLPGWAKADQDRIIAGAYNAWTQYGNVTVTQVATAAEADILMSVGSGARSNFDGPGGVLAWAYLPQGDDAQLTLKFDLAETWVMAANLRGIVLFNVACHEIGHLFGLDHSRIESALMAPYYNVAVAVPQANDDIPRFTARYGVKTNTPVPTPPPAVPTTPTPAPAPVPGTPHVDPVDVTVKLGTVGTYKGRLTLDPTSVTI